MAFRLIRDHYNARCQPPWKASDLRRKVAAADVCEKVPRGFRLTPAPSELVARWRATKPRAYADVPGTAHGPDLPANGESSDRTPASAPAAPTAPTAPAETVDGFARLLASLRDVARAPRISVSEYEQRLREALDLAPGHLHVIVPPPSASSLGLILDLVARDPHPFALAVRSVRQARAIRDALKDQGRPTEVRRSVLAVYDKRRRPVCAYFDRAKRFQEAGGNVNRAFCARCERKDVCPARRPEGNGTAQVGPYALLKTMRDDDRMRPGEGLGGAVIVSDSPEFDRPLKLTRANVNDAIDVLYNDAGEYVFLARYAAAIFPWVRIVELAFGVPGHSLTEAASQFAEKSDARALYERAFRLAACSWDPKARAWVDDPSTSAPRPTGNLLEDAQELARFASKDEQPALRVLSKQGRSVFKLHDGEFTRVIEGLKYLIPLRFAVEQSNMRWVDGVLRVRPLTLAMDNLTTYGGLLIDPAPLETQLRSLNRDVTFQHLDLEETAPIEREILYRANMNARSLCPGGGVTWSRVLPPLVEIMEAAERAGVQRLLLATFDVLARAIQATPPSKVEAWSKSGRHLALAGYWHDVEPGWGDCDGFVTFGDPWPNLDDVTEHAEAFGVDAKAEAERRLRAQLGHVHGIAKDATRAERAWHRHVGNRSPLGWHADNTTVSRVAQGRPPNVAAMSVDEFELAVRRLGGAKKVAVLLGLSITTIRRYLRGLRAVSEDVAVEILRWRP